MGIQIACRAAGRAHAALISILVAQILLQHADDAFHRVCHGHALLDRLGGSTRSIRSVWITIARSVTLRPSGVR
ncbi:hypothetical protein AJ87_30620 [Rhizobium yanglingense]|nr:hypothetical protein AJ87_30620 [Rhizobium yanglingense]